MVYGRKSCLHQDVEIGACIRLRVNVAQAFTPHQPHPRPSFSHIWKLLPGPARFKQSIPAPSTKKPQIRVRGSGIDRHGQQFLLGRLWCRCLHPSCETHGSMANRRAVNRPRACGKSPQALSKSWPLSVPQLIHSHHRGTWDW